MYSVQCTVYSVQCTVFSVQCSVYSVQCTVFSVQCSVHSVQPNWPQHQEPAPDQPEEKLGILVSGPFFEEFGPICLITAVRYRNVG